MNKCDNSYEEAVNKIRDFNKHRILSYCCFGPTGATGPTGPSGGATGATGPTGEQQVLLVQLVQLDQQE